MAAHPGPPSTEQCLSPERADYWRAGEYSRSACPVKAIWKVKSPSKLARPDAAQANSLSDARHIAQELGIERREIIAEAVLELSETFGWVVGDQWALFCQMLQKLLVFARALTEQIVIKGPGLRVSVECFLLATTKTLVI